MRQLLASIFTACLLTCSATARPKADSLIIPGQRVGQVSIGMEHAEVLQILGAPHREEDVAKTGRQGDFRHPYGPIPMPKGVLRDDWITPVAISKNANQDGGMWMCNFVSVYCIDRRVVQIEVRSEKFKLENGASTASVTPVLRKDHPHYTTVSCRYEHPSPGGIPATKHFVVIEDASTDGVAWRYGCMGNLAPDPDPDGPLEIIIIHAPGKPLIIDPDGGSRFIWKDAPERRSTDD